MRGHKITVQVEGDLAALRRQLARLGYRPQPVALDGWLAPRRQSVLHVERSAGFVSVWVGPFGLHLAWPDLHRTRLDFCADWWR